MIRALVARARALLARPFLRHVAVLAGAASLGQALVLLGYPILTRLYEPAHFGILAVFVAMLSTVLPVASLRYEFAVPLPRRDGTARHVLAVALASATLVSLLVAFVVLPFGGPLVAAVNAEELRPYLWLLPVGLWAASTYQALSYWAIRTESFPLLARTRLTQSIGSIAVQVALGFAHIGPLGLIVGNLFGHAAGAGRLAVAFGLRARTRFTRRGLRRSLWAARRYRRFAQLSAPASLLNTLAFSLPPIALAMLFGPTVAGWFALTDRVIGVPIGIATHSIGQVYVAEAARFALRDPASLQRRYLSLSLSMFVVVAVPLGLVAVYGPRLFALLFGDAWVAAGEFARILAVLYLARAVVNPLSQTLNLLERQGRMLALDALRAAAVVLVFVAAASWDMSASATIAWYGLAMTVSYGGYWLAALFAVRQRLPRPAAR